MPQPVQLDFKNASVLFMDGYSGPSTTNFLVNNGGGYAALATTMVIDTGTGVIQTGDRFQVVGSTQKHTVTAHTETSGNTTSITFTPGLTGAVLDNAVITILPHQLTVVVGDGSLSIKETHNREYRLDRGKLNYVRDGDETPIEVNLDADWIYTKSSTGESVSPYEAMHFIGAASSWVTTSPFGCGPKTLRMRVVIDPKCAGIDFEIVDVNYFLVESVDLKVNDGVFTFTAKSNEIRPTTSRVATYII